MKIALVFTFLFITSFAKAQVHGNPGGGGPGKGDEQYNICMDWKITVEQDAKLLLELEKKTYESEEDFFKYIDEEIIKIAVKQLNVFEQLNDRKNNKKLLPCGQEKTVEVLKDENEKLDLLKEIHSVIKKGENGNGFCRDIFRKYSYRMPEIEVIIKNYESKK
jgi:hypothetical protein